MSGRMLLPPRAEARGSGWIKTVLWLTFITPVALVYSIWRRAGVPPSCSACGGRDLVGLQTPVGRRVAAEYHPDGVPPPKHSAGPPSGAALASAARVAGALLAVFLGILIVAAIAGLARG